MKKVLYIVEDTESAQFRYRVKNVTETLKDSTKWEAEWVLKSEVEKIGLDGVDLLVVLRQTAKDRKILDLVDLAHKRGIKVLFDLDDLIFDYKDLPILMRATNSKNIVYWMGYVWGIRRIAKKMDGFIATNEFLAEKLKRSFKKPCAVIPNSLDKAQLEVAEKCLNKKAHDDFVVGYFSGSPTHAKDFRMVEPELIRFLDAHDNAKFLMVGYMELTPEMSKLVDSKKVEVMKLMNYLKLIELESKVDVNIAPLIVNDFTNSKSELKFFEAAAVETTTIASSSYTFKRVIEDGKNGFLAQLGEWYDKLEYLYNNSEKNQEVAKAARKYALENYYGKKFTKEVEEAYELFG